MKIVIEIDESLYNVITHAPNSDELMQAVKNGTPLDSIISQIEQARDKDKLCEYPYNRCIEILRRTVE